MFKSQNKKKSLKIGSKNTHILNPSELHNNIIRLILMNDLKILNRGLSDPAVEIENVALRILVPHRRLILQSSNIVEVFTLQF